MASRSTSWCIGLAVAGSLLSPSLTGVCRAMDQPPQATVIDLQFTEKKEEPNSWYGYGPDKEGKIQRPFANAAGKLTYQLDGDKVRIDTNGDGMIDDKDAPAIQSKSDRRSVLVHVAAKLGSRTVEYPLWIRPEQSGESRYLLVGSTALLEGKLGQYTIRIADSNQDGRFGSPSDQLSIQSITSQRPAFTYAVPYSRTVAVDRQLYHLDLSADAAKLKLTPYTGPVAEVQLEMPDSAKQARATLQEANGEQIGMCSPTEAGLFVPGKYRLYSVNFQSGPEERTAYLYGSHNSDQAPLELKPGRNVIKAGPPLTMDFTAIRKGDSLEFTQVTIAGKAGETYRPYIDKQQGDSFAAYIRANGKEQKLIDLGFG